MSAKMLISRATPLLRAVNASKLAPITRAYQLDTSFHRFPNYNDLPVPEGRWEDKYNKEQSKYNAALGAGVLAFVGTIIYLRTSGVLFINWAPPTHYE